MKKLMTTILFAMSAPAFGELKITQTSFWQTYYEDSFSFRLLNANKDLRMQCDYFYSTIWNEEGEEGWLDLQTFQYLNSAPMHGDMYNKSFYIEFKIKVKPNLVIVEDLGLLPAVQLLVANEKKSDLLPYFTQLPTEMKLYDSSFNSPLTVNRKEIKNFTQIADKLKVKLNDIFVTRQGSEIVIGVRDKATACDLMSNSVSLNLSAKGDVKILFANQIKLTNIYSHYQSLIEKSFAISKDTHIRAALLGANLANEINRNENGTRELDVPKFVKLLTHLLDVENMTPSRHWTDGIVGKNLSVTGSSSVVSINLHFEGPAKGE